MEHLRAYNLRLLSNILPLHVAEFFLKNKFNNDVQTSSLNSVRISFFAIASTYPSLWVTVTFCFKVVAKPWGKNHFFVSMLICVHVTEWVLI